VYLKKKTLHRIAGVGERVNLDGKGMQARGAGEGWPRRKKKNLYGGGGRLDEKTRPGDKGGGERGGKVETMFFRSMRL